MIDYSKPDLTQHPPRGRSCRLGGYAHLPRIVDKARALAFGKIGDYNYNCPADREFFDFNGIDHEELLAQAKLGKSDSEILAWISSKSKRLPCEVAAWSAWMDTLGPGTYRGHEMFSQEILRIARERDDIRNFSDMLALDDFASFGGRG